MRLWNGFIPPIPVLKSSSPTCVWFTPLRVAAELSNAPAPVSAGSQCRTLGSLASGLACSYRGKCPCRGARGGCCVQDPHNAMPSAHAEH